MIHYFVSFAHGDSNRSGFGNCQIDWPHPISSINDIHAVTDVLRREGVSNPTIVSFTRFDSDAADTAGGTR